MDEDTIMEIANALTSSALPKQSEDGDKDDNINTYLEKASDAWGGAAAASSKGTGIDEPKIDKTKLVVAVCHSGLAELFVGTMILMDTLFTPTAFPSTLRLILNGIYHVELISRL